MLGFTGQPHPGHPVNPVNFASEGRYLPSSTELMMEIL